MRRPRGIFGLASRFDSRTPSPACGVAGFIGGTSCEDSRRSAFWRSRLVIVIAENVEAYPHTMKTLGGISLSTVALK